MAKLLLSSILEYLKLQQDYNNGQADLDSLNETAKRFAQVLDEYIDHRIALAFDARRKIISKEKISLAEELNTSVKSTLKSFHSIHALSSAPAPPEDEKSIEDFFKEYNEWYQEKRAKGVEIE